MDVASRTGLVDSRVSADSRRTDIACYAGLVDTGVAMNVTGGPRLVDPGSRAFDGTDSAANVAPTTRAGKNLRPKLRGRPVALSQSKGDIIISSGYSPITHSMPSIIARCL